MGGTTSSRRPNPNPSLDPRWNIIAIFIAQYSQFAPLSYKAARYRTNRYHSLRPKSHLHAYHNKAHRLASLHKPGALNSRNGISTIPPSRSSPDGARQSIPGKELQQGISTPTVPSTRKHPSPFKRLVPTQQRPQLPPRRAPRTSRPRKARHTSLGSAALARRARPPGRHAVATALTKLRPTGRRFDVRKVDKSMAS